MFRCSNDVPRVQQIFLNCGPPPKTYYGVPAYDLPPTQSVIDSRCCSDDASDGIVESENVTVKFRISETQVVAQVYPNRMCLGDVLKDIARKFELDPKLLRLKQDDIEFGDECLVLDTIPDEFGIYEYSLTLLEPDKPQADGKPPPTFDLNVYYDKYRLPDFITVHIAGEDTEDGNPKNVVVEIQNKAIVKPFLCGYKDKATGIEYLDAFTQTGPYFDKIRFKHIYSRDTQTYEHKEKLIDTMHEQSSQCFLDGNNVLYVSAATDFTIVPRKYQTYAQKMRIEDKLNKIILIQRNWRRFLAVRFMRNAAKEYRRLVANRIEDEESFKREAEIRLQREQRAKQFPRTKDDFELLYTEVEKWKIAEMRRIAKMYDGAARKAEINLLLDKEIQLLNGVNRQRRLVFKAMEDFRNDQMMKKLGEPIKWIGYKDRIVHLDLLRTQRVRFLSEVFKDMQKPLPKQERLDLLTKVKEIIVKEQFFPEFPELFDLIEREKNLLLYTQYCDVEVLRKRQKMLFLELIKFSDVKTEDKNMRLCSVCKMVKPTSTFALRTRQLALDTCKKCYYMQFASTDNNTYRAILRAIQRDERKKRCTQSFAFILQVDDIRYLIDKIWHAHSILSMNEDLNSLRLPRWIRSDDWSPWNCICLTESEAHDHTKLEDVEKVYDKKLILKVRNAQMLARRIFQNMTAAGVRFLESGDWFKVGMNQQRTAIREPNFEFSDQSLKN